MLHARLNTEASNSRLEDKIGPQHGLRANLRNAKCGPNLHSTDNQYPHLTQRKHSTGHRRYRERHKNDPYAKKARRIFKR